MLDKWQKKEKPVFTGITRGIGGFGFGGGGVTDTESGEIQQLKVIHSGGLEEDISQLSSYSFQDGDIIEPILGDYTVTVKCAGQRGLRNGDYTTVNQGYGAWVQGTINMRYGTKYYVRISDGIGALYWGDSGAIPADNNYCMMLGAQGGDGKAVFAGFFNTGFSWSDDPNALGLGGNAGVWNPSGPVFSTGDTGQGSPGIDGSGGSINATGGTGGTTTGYLTGSGGTKGTATNPNDGGSLQNNTDGGFFSKGTAVFSGGDSDGGSGGMGYFGGGAGGGVNQGTGPAPRTGGGGGGGSSYAGGVPDAELPNPDNDDATVSSISSGLNDDPATENNAFVKTESTPTVVSKEERYWEVFEYGGASAQQPPDPSPAANGATYGFYTRTGDPSVDDGDAGSPDGIRERQIIWNSILVSGSSPNPNGWIIAGGYAYSWVDIITKAFPNFTGNAPGGTVSEGSQETPQVGSYYPWNGDQCNCFNVMRVDNRYAELYTADQLRPIVIQARSLRISGDPPDDDIWPEYFASNDPV